MSRELPWLRLYWETLADEKIDYIADDTELEKMYIMGIWTSVLMIAGKSNDRGSLMSGDNALNSKRIARTLQTSAEKIELVFGHFQDHGMLHKENGIWSISNWEARQPNSDSNAEKQKRYRERKKAVKTVEKEPETSEESNKQELLRNGYPVEGDKEVDKDTEIEEEKEQEEELLIPAPPSDFGTHLKFNRGVIMNVFGPQTDKIWPTVKAIQENCDMPGWPKLEGPIYDLIGYERFPEPADVMRISGKYRKDHPEDDYWPSTFAKLWRRELIASSVQSSKTDPKRQASIDEKNRKIFENAGITLSTEVPF